jgi:hypothetical protein
MTQASIVGFVTRRSASLTGCNNATSPMDTTRIQNRPATACASHLDEESLSAFVRELSLATSKILITELDVNGRDPPTAQRNQNTECKSTTKSRFSAVARDLQRPRESIF